MGLKRKRCPVLPVPHFLLSNVRHDVANCGDYQAAARTTCSAAELNRRPRYKRAMLALWLMTALGQTRRSKPTRDKSGLHLTADMRVTSLFGSRDSFTGSMRTMFHTRVGCESSRLSRTRNEQRLHVCTACHLGIRRLEVLAQFSLPDERARNNKGVLQAPCLPKCSVEKGIAEIGPLGLV